MNQRFLKCIMLLFATSLLAQQPFQDQAQSTFRYSTAGSAQTIDITNVRYEVVGAGIPGRAKDERLVLRTTTQTKQVVDDIGMEATTTVAAWPLGVDLTQKPLYSTMVAGVDMKTLNNEVFVISRGLEEVEWWSVYKLGSGAHLFDTYTPLLQFSTRRDVFAPRYVGMEVPPDDSSDKRLTAANVVGLLTYASPERVIREVMITADNPKTAQLLGSYADSTRTVSFANGRITVSISQNFPSPASTIAIVVPIAGDDLDVARSQLPAGIHVTAWKR